MEIRQLTTADFEERMALSQFAFQLRWSKDELEERRKTFRPENDWGAVDDKGTLLSALTVLPLETWVHGRKLAMGGVAGVATWPEARRQGQVGKLLVHAFGKMRDNGQCVSMLYPFSFSFYRKYGYELTVERKQYAIEARLLPSRKETPGEVKRMARPDFGVLHEVYSAYAAGYNGTLARTPEWWAERVYRKEGTTAVYYDEKGSARGYAFYDCLGGKMTVHELVYLGETARTALWTYLANHDSMVGEATLIAPIDDALPYLLTDPRIKQEIIPYFMSRIVDAQAYARLAAWEGTGVEESVLLKLEDRHAPWNDGTFRLSWSPDGEGRMERAEDGEDVITCDVATLSAMLLGGRKPTWLASVGRLSGPEESLRTLERRIPGGTPYLLDFF